VLFPYLEGDGSTFHPEQQAQLAQLATKAGTVPERVVTNVSDRLTYSQGQSNIDTALAQRFRRLMKKHPISLST
jgi:hypothetical protein